MAADMIGRFAGAVARRLLRAVVASHPYRRDILADLDEEHAEIVAGEGIDAAGMWYARHAIASMGPVASTSDIGVSTCVRLLPLVLCAYFLVLSVDRVANRLLPITFSIDHRLGYRVAVLAWIAASGALAARLVALRVRRLGFVANALLLLTTVLVGARYVANGGEHETAFRLAKVVTLAIVVVVTSILVLPQVADRPAEEAV